MTTPDDAHKQKLMVPPADLERVQTEPDLVVKQARSMLLLSQAKFFRMVMDDPDASASQFAMLIERLSKNARLEPQHANAGASGGITINFIRAPGRESVTIDATPAPAIENKDDE